ncbi:hypothetical protein F443_11734 [Phytophthora nicotianae P1569]|uniref:Uncharacterized protein n=1 Tax=Phytophthora nicotianae P1569 TaxID=1317065 RepID=V9EVI9_PHYNI|nr:hypothetical protein F443_11734 [Phytophthora nicotianae P1569]
MVVDVDPFADFESSSGSVHYQVSSPADSCPIFNYVRQSSTVLRKVRLGQRLDTALNCKSLPRFPLKQYPDPECSVRRKNVELVGTAPAAPICFRRDRHLDPLPVNRVRPLQVADSLSTSKSTPHKRYLLPSTDILKNYDELDPLQNSSSEDNNTGSEETARASNSPPDQHNAALIIARFFRSVCRLDSAVDRARDVLRRRWREQHPDKYRTPLFELTNSEQLRVLQLYNPHLYGSQHPASPLATTSTSMRLARVPQMEQHKRTRQLEILARMNRETQLLNETSRQKTQAPISTTTILHKAYQRQPLAFQERPKTVLGRERLQQAHDLVMYSRTPPSFRYKTTPQSRLQVTHTLKSVSTLRPL